MRRFDSDPRLQLPPELASLPRSLAMLGISARGSDAAYAPQVRFRPAPPVSPLNPGPAGESARLGYAIRNQSSLWSSNVVRCTILNHAEESHMNKTGFLAVAILAGVLIAPLSAQEMPKSAAAPKPAPSASEAVLEQWNDIGRKLIAMAED